MSRRRVPVRSGLVDETQHVRKRGDFPILVHGEPLYRCVSAQSDMRCHTVTFGYPIIQEMERVLTLMISRKCANCSVLIRFPFQHRIIVRGVEAEQALERPSLATSRTPPTFPDGSISVGNPAPHRSHRHSRTAGDVAGAQIFRDVRHFAILRCRLALVSDGTWRVEGKFAGSLTRQQAHERNQRIGPPQMGCS